MLGLLDSSFVSTVTVFTRLAALIWGFVLQSLLFCEEDWFAAAYWCSSICGESLGQGSDAVSFVLTSIISVLLVLDELTDWAADMSFSEDDGFCESDGFVPGHICGSSDTAWFSCDSLDLNMS